MSDCPTGDGWYDAPGANYCPFCGSEAKSTDIPAQNRCTNGGGTFYIE